jgi:hypothetical protein
MSVRPATLLRPIPSGWVTLAAAAGALLGYTLAVDPVVHSVQQLLYPIVWLAASGAALWLVRDRLSGLTPLPIAVGAAYTLVLLWTAGLVGQPGAATGLSVHLGLPGWSPTVFYTGTVISLTLVPFLVVGYVTLGVLVASALGATLETTAAGAIGLFACVSCTAPLFAGLAGSLGAGSLLATISTAQYPLATAAFLLSAGTLVGLTRHTA